MIAFVRAKTVIEFGANSGRTAKAILRNVKTVERYLGIDVPPTYVTPKLVQRREVPPRPGEMALDDPRFRLLLARHGSHDLSPDDLPAADAIFIDGDHSAAGVRGDYALAKAKLRPGGIIIFHDDNGRDVVDVSAVLDDLCAQGADIKHVAGTWLAFERVGAAAADDHRIEVVPPKTGTRVAVIVGGGGDPLAEVEKAKALCAEAGAIPEYFIINDWIAVFPEPATAVSLHPDKLPAWLAARAANGLPPLTAICAHKAHPVVTDVSADWNGSSSLLGVKRSRERGFDKILLCGVPMAPEGGNIFHKMPRWNMATNFQKGWQNRRAQIAPYVRSFSGWTAETFGRPDIAFLVRP